jgi:CRISPR-associated protein Cas5t
MVGEVNRKRHERVRITAGLIGQPDRSVVLRTVWRVKSKPLGSSGNSRPDYQQLLSNIRLTIWIDSSDEDATTESLELRVRAALSPDKRGSIDRFGGLSLGESSHLVDEVSFIDCIDNTAKAEQVQLFVVRERGRYTLPVWVDHVGSAGTLYVTGDLETRPLALPPSFNELPIITSPRTI